MILSGQFWGELRVFLAVAKAKSFNRAADMLGTSHPTVARQVKRLQDMIGSELYVSTKTGVRLTQKGEELAKSLTMLDQSLFSLANDLKDTNRDAEGQVRLSISDGLAVAFVAPNLARFSSEHPRVQLSIKALQNVNNLREDQNDILVGFSVPSSAEMHHEALGFLHVLPMASREYVRVNGLPTRANLTQHRFVHSDFYAQRAGIWDRWFNAIHLGHVAHVCEDAIGYAMMVKSGAGIGLLPSYTTLDPLMVPVDLDIHIVVPLYAIAPTERLRSVPVRLAFDWLCDLFSTENPWLSRDLRLGHMPSQYDIGFRMGFNI